MSRFIEVTDGTLKRFLNIDNIEQVQPSDEGAAIHTINSFYYVEESYEDVKLLIRNEIFETDRKLTDIAQMIKDY